MVLGLRIRTHITWTHRPTRCTYKSPRCKNDSLARGGRERPGRPSGPSALTLKELCVKDLKSCTTTEVLDLRNSPRVQWPDHVSSFRRGHRKFGLTGVFENR